MISFIDSYWEWVSHLNIANKWFNYQHLLYFMTIAQEGGVAKASSKLKLGQSTLSTQLSQFENYLGLKLFTRRQQRLHLTEVGHIALQYAQEIFKLGDEMVDALHDRRQSHRISVQIGAMAAIPKATLVELVMAARLTQECSISVTEGSASELIRALKSHTIDLGILNFRPAAAELNELEVHLAGRLPIVILGSEEKAKLASNFPESLNDQSFIMPAAGSALRHELDLFFKLQQIQVDRILEAQDSSLQALLAARGAGLLAVSTAVAKELKVSHNMHILGVLEGVFDEVWLISSERRLENPVASSLLKNFKF